MKRTTFSLTISLLLLLFLTGCIDLKERSINATNSLSIVLEIEQPGEVSKESALHFTEVVKRRAIDFGVSEPEISDINGNRITVYISGSENEDVARNLFKTANLEFKTESGEIILSGNNISDAYEQKDFSGSAVVTLTFNQLGAEKLSKGTAANVGRPISIFLDGQLLQKPIITEPITCGKANITGYNSIDEAHRIAILLRSGTLPFKVRIIEINKLNYNGVT